MCASSASLSPLRRRMVRQCARKSTLTTLTACQDTAVKRFPLCVIPCDATEATGVAGAFLFVLFLCMIKGFRRSRQRLSRCDRRSHSSVGDYIFCHCRQLQCCTMCNRFVCCPARSCLSGCLFCQVARLVAGRAGSLHSLVVPPSIVGLDSTNRFAL